jgi:hypothetical protein
MQTTALFLYIYHINTTLLVMYYRIIQFFVVVGYSKSYKNTERCIPVYYSCKSHALCIASNRINELT